MAAASDALDKIGSLLDRGEVRSALGLLEKGSETEPAIAFAFALRLLSGNGLPRDVARARALLRSAMERGHVDAAAFEMAMMANGFGGRPDWSGALALLSQWSDRDEGARRQKELLAAMDLADDGMPRVPPERVCVATSPDIFRVSAFATQAECEYLARSVVDILAPSVVYDPNTGEQRRHPIRRSSGAVVGPTREDLVISALARRIAAATETDWRAGEPFQILHYAPGEEYRLHHDTVANDPNPRAYTAILYLNGGFIGGETYFPANRFAAIPRVGDLVFFHNLNEAGEADPRAAHAGMPLREGTKWIATRWIRQHPLDLATMAF